MKYLGTKMRAQANLPTSGISFPMGIGVVKNVCSFNRLSGTGLTINRLPAEWTTWVKELGGTPKQKKFSNQTRTISCLLQHVPP